MSAGQQSRESQGFLKGTVLVKQQRAAADRRIVKLARIGVVDKNVCRRCAEGLGCRGNLGNAVCHVETTGLGEKGVDVCSVGSHVIKIEARIGGAQRI
ncbi:hypothetical protein SDC9_120819 [bioreactor metagenome]|uniref:Uncharacterized protein n=1 Tax=bioreactor metagenome TaxID=1076179 RepID=A0A645CA77_9ZZZZ